MNEGRQRPDQAADLASKRAATWRDARIADAETIGAIEKRVHVLAPERIEVHREKIALFSVGCGVLAAAGRIVGYGIAYPWRLDDVPPLDCFLGAIPQDAACLSLHDVAILPEARALGASRSFVGRAALVAAQHGLSSLALVSVYGTDGLWRSHGFVASPSSATSFQLGPYGSTAIYMVRRLT